MAWETSSDRVGRRIEHDHPLWIAMLPGHQIADGGLIVGAVEIGLDERCAVSAEAVHDDVEVFGRCRDKRGPITHDATPTVQPDQSFDGLG